MSYQCPCVPCKLGHLNSKHFSHSQHGNMASALHRSQASLCRQAAHNMDSDDDLFMPITHRHSLSNFGATWKASSVAAVDCDRQRTFPGSEQKAKLAGLGRQRNGQVVTAKRDRSESCSSIVDGLLCEIYDRWHFPQRGDSFDSDTFTECSSTSEAFLGRTDSLGQEQGRLNRAYLENKDIEELQQMVGEMKHHVTQLSARLIRELKRKDRRIAKLNKHSDVVTAILQASSLKRRIDSRIRFSIEPLPGGDDAFQQWRDAMQAVARLPLGIPPEFRKKVWLALADNHITALRFDWDKTKRFAFNERSNPDDNALGMQIVKDLHRTGCSGFNGEDNEEDRAVLKRVLLAYARWNKQVGYCQGFNVIAALILDVMNRKEDHALKAMIYLIDFVLPDSYFANNLRALSVDMAVFRELLALQLPKLSKHLDYLQAAARDHSTGANYEPPLTNVFTMQWFLTIFATCLPKSTALRVWDSVMLEGSEILLRAALAIWEKLQDRILKVQSADEFYTTMGVLTQEMLDDQIIDPDDLIKTIYTMAPFPFPQLGDIREKYTYNITPFTAAMSTGQRPTKKGGMNIFSDDDEIDEDDLVDQISCFTGIFPTQVSPSKKLGEADRSQSASSFDISKASPGAYAATPQPSSSQHSWSSNAHLMERMTTDMGMLKKQYGRLRERQKQAHVILQAASAAHKAKHQSKPRAQDRQPKTVSQTPIVAPIESPMAVNHLFIGRRANNKRNRHVTKAPGIAPFYPKRGLVPTQLATQSHSDQGQGQIDGQRSRSASIASSVSEVETASGKKDKDKDKTDYTKNQRRLSEQSSDSVLSEASNNTRGYPESDSDTIADLEHSDTGDVEDRISLDVTDKLQEESNADLSDDKEVENRCDDNTNNDENNSNQDSPVFQDDLAKKNNMRCDVSLTCDGKSTLLQLSQSNQKNQGLAGNRVDNPSKTPGSDDTAAYVTKLTYKGHKKLQPLNNNSIIQSDTSVPADIQCSSNEEGPSSPEHKPQRVFNPFPGRSTNSFPTRFMNSKKAQNGIKLGLYSADSIPFTETVVKKPTFTRGTNIGRSQINSCLHRQYMAEVKQQAKAYK